MMFFKKCAVSIGKNMLAAYVNDSVDTAPKFTIQCALFSLELTSSSNHHSDKQACYNNNRVGC